MSYTQFATIKEEILIKGCQWRKLRQPSTFNRPQRTTIAPQRDHKTPCQRTSKSAPSQAFRLRRPWSGSPL